MEFNLNPGQLSLMDLRLLLDPDLQISLNSDCFPAIKASVAIVNGIVKTKQIVYGINTGFGALANTPISEANVERLQHNILLSHAAGCGAFLEDEVVRLALALKINSLARGYSGVRLETIDALVKLFNAKLYPCIPAKGSVGASGDLAPLAHLSAVLLGVGHVRHQHKIISAKDALEFIGLKPLHLAAKEGLALVNGTQISTALALIALFAAENLYLSAIISGALSTDAMRGSDHPFDARIQTIRPHPGQIRTAELLRELLAGSAIRESHLACSKVQDPYSVRCQPQVMGACLQQLSFAAETLLIEANAVSDNPLIFADDKAFLSGGNFHAEPIAMCADMMAISIAEMGSLSERRTALLIDPRFSGLPAFLIEQAGINSGFMLAQVTSAALVSENKTLAHPASVDSIPTSANQEDHVSMATFAAYRLGQMIDNVAYVIAIELLCGCQGIDFLRPLKTSKALEEVHARVRREVPFFSEDRFLAPDISAIQTLVREGDVHKDILSGVL